MKLENKIKKILASVKYKKYRNFKNIKEIEYKELKNLLRTEANIILIDIRSPKEFSEGKISSAINIPLYDLERKVEIILKDKSSFIVVYCQHGIRSKKACDILEKKGYINIFSLKGGIESIL